MANEYKLSYTASEIEVRLGRIDNVEPAEEDIPKVFITGIIPTTKTDVEAEMDYISKTDKFHAYITIKCQGSSSMSYPKKNFTIKMYSDKSRETKLKKKFKDWGFEAHKFVLKANYIDHSHARNIVSARLWDQVVKSRSNYASLPEEMKTSPRSGAIDGFPIKVYTNDTYQGLYTWNIGKESWMWAMDEDNPNHILLSCCYNDNGVLLDKAGNFRALWSGVNEDNWKVEVGTNSDAVKTSLNNLISCVKDTDDETFKATIGNYLDINSALDYYLYFWANAGLDSLENNMLLATYDGVKWICGAYDMDSVWGLHYNGQKFISVEFKCPDQYQGPYSLLWERIKKLFTMELSARYTELRNDILSYPNIVTHFERFMDVIGSELYAEDLTIYTDIPSGSTNNINQIRSYVRDRLAYVDAEVGQMSEERVPCTGISLSESELIFTADGSQTLIATVTPSNTTDEIVWATTNNSVASVAGGVVTAVGNGSATITATCGEYSVSCNVSVSGMIARPVVWLRGSDFSNDLIHNGEGSFLDAATGKTISFANFEGTANSGAGENGEIVLGTANTPAERMAEFNDINIQYSAFTFFYKGHLTPNQSKKYIFFADDGSTNGLSVIFGYVANTVELYSDVNIRAGSQIKVDDGLEHSIVYAYDGNKLTGYLDGNKVVDVTKGALSFSNANRFYLCCDRPVTVHNTAQGAVKYIQFYNVALSEAEIQTVLSQL